ncbi:hypothetical protein [Methylobacterium platani]|uniref:Uncharacterized protein n=2 Tax=Methylobacterium platani TaxID=427683 RepID=A0A179SBP9_9HYPH|nr:hypothetical protein [Methylobacterium platani]KMO15987.1 hypothetical protein SQ03_15535 [Methylobacterium platani JCM 14648]OAS24882.1 hypothetical protein A5481_12380 [Methylobacterium platani]
MLALADVYAAIVSVPEGVLKAAGAVLGGDTAAGFYLWGRLRTLRPPGDAVTPRVALSESDRQLGFTIIATGTDLTRALNEHGALLRRRRRS